MSKTLDRVSASSSDAGTKECTLRLHDAAYGGAANGVGAGVETREAPPASIAPDSLPDLQLDNAIQPGTTTHTTIMVEGQPRQFLLHIPKNYDGANKVPLMVMFNGANGSPASIEELTKMSEKADQEGFIVAYPAGIGPLGTFNNGEKPYSDGGVDDVAFTRQMIDTLSADLSIDKQRVYLAGFSQGGSFAHLAASQLSDRVAAVADVSGWTTGLETAPAHAVDSISIHGDHDGVVAYGGTQSLPTSEPGGILGFLTGPLKTALDLGTGNIFGLPGDLGEIRNLIEFMAQTAGLSYIEPQSYTTDFWRRADGITTAATQIQTGVANTDIYRGTDGTEVEQVTIINGEHAWPGSTQGSILGNPTADYNATDEIWSFLGRHHLDESSDPIHASV